MTKPKTILSFAVFVAAALLLTQRAAARSGWYPAPAPQNCQSGNGNGALWASDLSPNPELSSSGDSKHLRDLTHNL